MRRLFWVAVGAGAGIYAVRRLSRAAEAYTPAGLAKGIAELGDSLRYFADEVRAAMAVREAELRESLGLEGGAGDADAVHAGDQALGAPSTPHTSAPHTSAPHTSAPHTFASHTFASHTSASHTSAPHTSWPPAARRGRGGGR